MKTFFALVGAATFALWLLGTLGIGNFVLMYSPNKITCIKATNE